MRPGLRDNQGKTLSLLCATLTWLEDALRKETSPEEAPDQTSAPPGDDGTPFAPPVSVPYPHVARTDPLLRVALLPPQSRTGCVSTGGQAYSALPRSAQPHGLPAGSAFEQLL